MYLHILTCICTYVIYVCAKKSGEVDRQEEVFDIIHVYVYVHICIYIYCMYMYMCIYVCTKKSNTKMLG